MQEVELYKHEHGQNPADVKKALDDVSILMVESAHVAIDQLHLEFHEEVLLLALKIGRLAPLELFTRVSCLGLQLLEKLSVSIPCKCCNHFVRQGLVIVLH